MSPQTPEPADADQPLDAIVYEVHPALAPPPRVEGTSPFAPQQGYPYGAYPYGSRPPAGSAETDGNPVRATFSVLSEMFRPLNIDLGRKADYVVPQRFGMSALLGIMTALAVLFGGLRLLDAPPSVYLFFGVQALVICIAQMFQGRTPRAASAVAGAILLPLFALFAAAYSSHGPPVAALSCMLVVCIPAGAFLGYITGTCAAGVFLLMDGLERYLKGQRPIFQTAGPTLPGGAPGTAP